MVDLAPLQGQTPLAVRLAWPLFGQAVGKADDACCTSQVAKPNTNPNANANPNTNTNPSNPNPNPKSNPDPNLTL